MSPHLKWLVSGIGLVAVVASSLTLIGGLLVGATTVFGLFDTGPNRPLPMSIAIFLTLIGVGLMGLMVGASLLKDPDLRNLAGPPPTPRRLAGQGIRFLIIGTGGLVSGLFTQSWLAWVLIGGGIATMLLGLACLALSRRTLAPPPASNR